MVCSMLYSREKKVRICFLSLLTITSSMANNYDFYLGMAHVGVYTPDTRQELESENRVCEICWG